MAHDIVIPQRDGTGKIAAVENGMDPARIGQRVWLWNAQGGYHDDDHKGLSQHLAYFIRAYNFARRLKARKCLTPRECICKIWTSESERFTLNPIHQMPGVNTLIRTNILAQLDKRRPACCLQIDSDTSFS